MLKSKLIRTTAVKLAVNEKIVEAIINHQFQSAKEATDIHRTVELSGMGTFIFKDKKAKLKVENLTKYIKNMEAQLENPEIAKSTPERLKSILSRAKQQLSHINQLTNEL